MGLFKKKNTCILIQTGDSLNFIHPIIPVYCTLSDEVVYIRSFMDVSIYVPVSSYDGI